MTFGCNKSNKPAGNSNINDQNATPICTITSTIDHDVDSDSDGIADIADNCPNSDPLTGR